MKTCFGTSGLLIALCLLLAACNYDFPLTNQPTRPIEPGLVGNWVSYDQDAQKILPMSVRRLDDTTYVVSLDGDLYRAFHSDFAGLALLSIQNLQPGSDAGKYSYYRYARQPDGDHLSLWGVNPKVIPEGTKSQDEAQKLIKANLANPKLFVAEMQFTRKK
ncbi:MAG: hypothetical protein WCR49_08140 [Opitutae bacterium]